MRRRFGPGSEITKKGFAIGPNWGESPRERILREKRESAASNVYREPTWLAKKHEKEFRKRQREAANPRRQDVWPRGKWQARQASPPVERAGQWHEARVRSGEFRVEPHGSGMSGYAPTSEVLRTAELNQQEHDIDARVRKRLVGVAKRLRDQARAARKSGGGGDVAVSGYTRSGGVEVSPYTRSKPS